MDQFAVDDNLMPTLPVAVVVDVDPDWRMPGPQSSDPTREMRWEGLRRGVPSLLRMLTGLRDSGGKPIRFTWMVRADEQIASVYGDAGHIADEFADFWSLRLAAGDEIGWHPHTWRYSEREAIWYQEYSDQDWVRECLRDGFQALSRRYPIRAAKTGWTYHDNFTMRTLTELGVRVDLSALPGMAYHGAAQASALPLGDYDWSRTPQEPYHPRIDDYQVPGEGQALGILEVPNWTYPVGRARGLQHSIRHRSLRDFANPAKRASLVRRAFSGPPYTVPFVCYFHPEELLGPTWLFGLRNVFENLSLLLQTCHDRGLRSSFVVASEICSGS